MIFTLRRVRSVGRPDLSVGPAQEQSERGRFREAPRAGRGVRAFVDSLPSILAGATSRRSCGARAARETGDAGIVWGIGAHVIKTGLSPVLIDLMERGFVSALAMNGAGVIHDFELALSGATSEDVDEALGPGRFGMAEETGTLLNAAISDGVARGLGHRPGGRAHTSRRAIRRTPSLEPPGGGGAARAFR